jgi:hypothetical protein
MDVAEVSHGAEARDPGAAQIVVFEVVACAECYTLGKENGGQGEVLQKLRAASWGLERNEFAAKNTKNA